uniref:Uncharacterized protein n=1 Tax=Pavo cristatus TaxID=9049 RepID=A0A8C9EP39_PAVCR
MINCTWMWQFCQAAAGKLKGACLSPALPMDWCSPEAVPLSISPLTLFVSSFLPPSLIDQLLTAHWQLRGFGS